jgi:hypothetical protein
MSAAASSSGTTRYSRTQTQIDACIAALPQSARNIIQNLRHRDIVLRKHPIYSQNYLPFDVDGNPAKTCKQIDEAAFWLRHFDQPAQFNLSNLMPSLYVNAVKHFFLQDPVTHEYEFSDVRTPEELLQLDGNRIKSGIHTKQSKRGQGGKASEMTLKDYLKLAAAKRKGTVFFSDMFNSQLPQFQPPRGALAHESNIEHLLGFSALPKLFTFNNMLQHFSQLPEGLRLNKKYADTFGQLLVSQGELMLKSITT